MKRSYASLLVAMVLVAIMWVTAQSMAQQAAAAGAAPAAAAADQKMTLWRMWVVGGPIMWPIGLCSVAVVGLTIYCFMAYRSDKMLRPDLVQRVQASFDKLDIEGAIAVCDSTPAPLTNVLGAGLRRISDGVLDVASMEKAMEEASVEETNEGLKPLNNLSIASQISPMLGLLGTVTGMIDAFNKIGLGAMGDPEKLANSIGEAMLTTAFGLIVAIPAMFFYFFLKGQYMANMTRLGRIIGNLTHHLVTASRRASENQGDAAAGAALTGEK